MKIKAFVTAAGLLALGLATWLTPSKAQGPMYDTVYVNLPYSVTISNKTLQPGDYTIKELPSQDKSRVLLIYSDHGMKFETSAMTIPAYDPNTLENTKVVLHHFGPDYYFDKVWIQGKNYGYEFPLPDSVKSREKESLVAVTVPARYEATQASSETTVSQQTAVAETETAQAPAAREEVRQETVIAQNTTPEPAPVAEPSANRDAEPAPAPQNLPATSAGWLMMLLSGGTLSGAGLMLRRKW
jgi:hypothetical protein